MLRNYFKIAWRNLMKRKAYSFINILGLSLGAAICLLIVQFIQSEKRVDAWRSNSDDVYRMVLKRKYPTRESSYAIIPQSFAKTLKEELPQVEETVRIFNFFSNGTFQIKYGEDRFEETKVFITDPSFFKVFKSEFLFGNENDALSIPNSTVITERTAIKYFGDASEAVGKTLLPEGANSEPLKVTAVVRDWPEASHFTFNLLLSTAGKPNFEAENYVAFSAYTYLKLNPNATYKSVESAFPGIIEKFATSDIQRQFAMSYDEFLKSGNGYSYTLQPLKDIYLTSHLEAEFRANGNSTALYIFGFVALFIMIIAGINFVNLSTARASERAREVGVRKTFGSQRNALVFQFLTESLLLSLLSMVLAIGVYFLLVPVFNDISGKAFQATSIFSSEPLSLLLLFSVVMGFLAGLYPAFVLSSFKPISVLRGKFKSSSSGKALRSGLVVFQFTISVTLIICTLIVNRQMNFMTNEKLGFNKERTVIIESANVLGANTEAFKNELRELQGIKGVSSTSALPGQANYFGVTWTSPKTRNEPMTGRGILVDTDYQKTLGLELLEGRFFSEEFGSDSLTVVLNERAVMELELENPIGKRIYTPDSWLNANNGDAYNYEVIGVVKDFHYQSLHEPISPLVFNNASRFNNVMSMIAVSLNKGDLASNIASLEDTWQHFVKDKPFSYSFLDTTINNQYKAESTARKVFIFFSGVAIFIACLGLLGLAAYTTRQRVQEIGVRKVLGASAVNIVALLSKDFIKWVLMSTLIAIPLAWYAMHQWLQNFSYRIDTSWDIFAFASILASITAFVTISVQAIKAALANPVDSLRSE
ncbi:MAG: ABC transporter permease [Bacteroidota bacterium]